MLTNGTGYLIRHAPVFHQLCCNLPAGNTQQVALDDGRIQARIYLLRAAKQAEMGWEHMSQHQSAEIVQQASPAP